MQRTYVRIRLKTDSTWRIGALGSEDLNTAEILAQPPLSVAEPDVKKPVVPGSSIAGSMRAGVGKRGDELFGYVKDRDTKNESAGSDREFTTVTSPWWILGTDVTSPSKQKTRVRNRVDRRRGAAQEKALFEVGFVASESDITLYLRREHSEETSGIIKELAQALSEWKPRIGGGLSIGMGVAHIEKAEYCSFDLANVNHLRVLCAADVKGSLTPIERVDALFTAEANEGMFGAVEIKLDSLKQSSGGTYLNAKVHIDVLGIATNVDKSLVDEESVSRFAGSSIKGIIRSRVEFIGRSLGYKCCGADGDSVARGADWSGCGNCAVCVFFGSPQSAGLFAFRDGVFDDSTTEHEVNRIAIDRFTGGAHRGSLWEQKYLRNVNFDLNIDRNQMVADSEWDEHDSSWVHRALLWVFRDINDGLVAFGPHSAAGYGIATVENVQLVDGTAVDLKNLAPVRDRVRADKSEVLA